MGNDCMKYNENIYFKCRKEAALYNDKLNSREGAAELLGISVSSLADYELGMTKVVPVDKVVLMADLYNAPELMNHYCRNECPIGCRKDIPDEIESLQNITLNLLDLLSPDKLTPKMKQLTRIAKDGEVTNEEQAEMNEIVNYLGEIKKLSEKLQLSEEKRKLVRDVKC